MRGKTTGLAFLAAVAELSTLANAGLVGAKEVDATRRVGNEDRAKASAAGVGRVTAVRQQYAEAIVVAPGPIVPPGPIDCPTRPRGRVNSTSRRVAAVNASFRLSRCAVRH